MSHSSDRDIVHITYTHPYVAQELKELCMDLLGLDIIPHLHGSRAYSHFSYNGDKIAELYVGNVGITTISSADIFTVSETTDWDLAVPNHPEMVDFLKARGYRLLESEGDRYTDPNGYMDSNTTAIYRKFIVQDKYHSKTAHFDVSIRNDFKLFQTVMSCIDYNVYDNFLRKRENATKRLFLEAMYKLYRESVSSGLWR